MPREKGRQLVAQNKKARHDYSIEDVYEAGLVLTGTEVKSLRAGRLTIGEGYVRVHKDEVWLESVHIPPYEHGTYQNHEPRRTRKLLLRRSEIRRLTEESQARGYTLVPLRMSCMPSFTTKSPSLTPLRFWNLAPAFAMMPTFSWPMMTFWMGLP